MSPEEITRHPEEVLPKVVRALTFSAIANVVLVVLVAALVSWTALRKPVVIASTETGRIIPIVPLDKPYTSDARVVSFADECVRAALSHDFVNYRQTMLESSRCFTTDGANSFYRAMEPLLRDLEQKRMVMSATSVRPAVIVKPFERAGVRSWLLQSIVAIHREGTRERITPATYVVSMVVERVPLEDSPRGISVAQIDMKPGNVESKL